MSQTITKPSLRVKITGACNRTCNFCNEEGDMRTIIPVDPDPAFFECVYGLTEKLLLTRVMLTGGEPTLHPKLREIVMGISSPNISVTTNGIRLLSTEEWIELREAGLRKVTVSIHDATPQSFMQLETRQRQFGWAILALESQKQNLIHASEAGLSVSVNTVAHHSYGQVLRVLDSLGDLQRKYPFSIKLLNDLANIEKSQQIIRDVCQSLGARTIKEERRAGSSNTTILWETDSGLRFSTKMAYPYFFNPICSECPIKTQCHEGFYGVRLERRVSDYWVRLCIYKHSLNVLMPWKSFLESKLSDELRELCEREQS